jgi:hypothetical protein
MNLNEEQLKDIYSEVEEMAGLFFSADEIAINFGYNEEQTEDFVFAVENKQMSGIVSAYWKGRLTAEITLRKAIKQSALNGSSPSQQMMLNFQKESHK